MTNPSGTSGQLPRVIGAGRLALMMVGITIGTAIFRVPSVIAADAGTPWRTAIVWLIGALFAVAGGLCAAELGARLPGAGGEYALARAVYGDRIAFVFGVTWLLLGSPASIAAVARAFADYAAVFVPLSEAGRRVLTAVVIGLHTALAVASTRVAARVIGAATLAKLGALGLVAVAAFLFSPGPAAAPPPLPATAGSAASLIAAIVAVIWAFDGSATITMAGDVEDPGRNIPRALFLGTAIVVVIYTLANLAYGKALGFGGLAASSAVAADTMNRLVGRGGALVVAAMVLLSAYSCGMAQLVSHPRVTFGLAADRLFFPRFATLARRTRTPWVAIVAHGVVAAILSTTGGYEFLVRLVVFSYYPLIGAIYAGAIVLRRREGPPRTFRMPLYPLPIVLYCLLLAVVLAVSLVSDPPALMWAAAVVGAAWLASGLVRPEPPSPPPSTSSPPAER